MRAVLMLVAALAAAGCAGPREAAMPATRVADAAPATAVPQGSAFQRLLDGYGIDLTVPQTGKAILVNIPGQELIALQDGEPVLRSRVIVGAPQTQTPLIDTAVSVVRFRPSWRPTPKMVAMGLYEDKVIPPGPRNPLGLAAVRFADGGLVYLHGTNRPALFGRDRRALSFGCVRVEQLDALIAWLLDVDEDQARAWQRGGRSFDKAVADVPVLLRYHTVFPDADGVLREHPDIYGRGRSLIAAACPAGGCAAG